MVRRCVKSDLLWRRRVRVAEYCSNYSIEIIGVNMYREAFKIIIQVFKEMWPAITFLVLLPVMLHGVELCVNGVLKWIS